MCQKGVGKGAGGNLIGFRIETENCLETPPVPIEYEGKKVKLVLAEDFTSYSGYHVTKDKVVLTARFDEDKVMGPVMEYKQIF